MNSPAPRSRRRTATPEAPAPRSHLESWLVFVFGIIFCTVILILTTAQKNPTPLMVDVYIKILALAGGGIGAFLPGLLEVTFNIELQHKFYIRAGGALGVFVLLLLSQPSLAKYVPQYVNPSTSPNETAAAFLAAVDTGDPANSWNLLSDMGKDQVGNDGQNWSTLYNNVLKPLGAAESRSLVNETKELSPPGLPPGYY
jgi:hypothetical protein